VNPTKAPDWQAIRARASEFPESAYQFIRDGLTYTVARVHGAEGADEPFEGAEPKHGQAMNGEDGHPHRVRATRHVTGRDLSLGLRDYAMQRYGMLAGAVMRRWGIRGTEDWGVLVYAMIDRGEMRASERDSLDDFRGVFDFDEVFGSAG
jgi:uncharacterized repeat protein (TIGR04138 family)